MCTWPWWHRRFVRGLHIVFLMSSVNDDQGLNSLSYCGMPTGIVMYCLSLYKSYLICWGYKLLIVSSINRELILNDDNSHMKFSQTQLSWKIPSQLRSFCIISFFSSTPNKFIFAGIRVVLVWLICGVFRYIHHVISACIRDYNITAWRFGCKRVAVTPGGGMCKVTSPDVKHSCIPYGDRTSTAHLTPVSIWFIVIILKPEDYTSKWQTDVCLCQLVSP